MKIEPNMYVRTKYGISKCIKIIPIRENSFMYEFDREVYEDVYFLTYSELEKYKSSSNIIDLIEAGDYVNGKLVIDKWEEPFGAFAGETFIKLDGEDSVPTIRAIKSIVTKEQFESMEYSLEG